MAVTADTISLLAIYGAMACYAVAMVAFAVDLSGRGGHGSRRQAASIGMSVTWLGFALHLVGLVARGIAAGRAPWANMYEFCVTFTLVAVGVFLGLSLRRQAAGDIRYLGVFITGPVLLLLGLATSVLYIKPDGVPPALQSYWLVIHVALATLAAGVLSVSAGFSVLHLAQDGRERRLAAHGPRRAWDPWLTKLPASATLETAAFRLAAVGFVLWTFTVVAGAIWAKHAWGRYWGWDPKEVWSFVVWVIYAAYLHARVTTGIRRQLSSIFALVAYGFLLFNFIGVNLWFSTSSLHTYTGIR